MIPPALDRDGPRRLLDEPGVQVCLAALRAPGEETRLVGGCVRDALLGRDVADLDLATTLPPSETMARARAAGIKAVPTGFDHGTVTLVIDGRPLEVTTLREDIETDGRHARVRYGRDFVRDAERRDFTINALSLDEGGQIHDTTGGLVDLAAARVRFIGDPSTRIAEDALRILRFFRFHARYGGDLLDEAGFNACIAARDALARLSRERVRSEFLKILMAPGAVAVLRAMSDVGLLLRITGGVAELGRFAKLHRGGAMAVSRLAALSVFSPADAERLAEALRLSRAERAALECYARALAAMRSVPHVSQASVRALAATHGRDTVRVVAQAIDGEPNPQISGEARAWLDQSRQAEQALILPVTGADLVARGLTPGPVVGRALGRARAIWLEDGCPTGADVRARLIDVALESVRTDATLQAVETR